MQAAAELLLCILPTLMLMLADVGVPVLSMHSPYEIVSKIDTYMAYKAFKVFFLIK